MASVQRISPCLWFDNEAEQAAAFYTSIFPHSHVGRVARYGEAGRAETGRVPGSVLTVQFYLDGAEFTALNGGPQFKFGEAVSFQVLCDTQQEIDYYWEELGDGGDPAAQVCGWLKDRFGLSWQIVPRKLAEMLANSPNPATEQVMEALMAMKKLDIAALEQAYRSA